MIRPFIPALSIALTCSLAPAALGQCLEQRIENPRPIEGAEFGTGVWLEGDRLVVSGGGIHIYSRFEGEWQLQQTIDGSSGASSASGRVDFDGTRIVAGGNREAFVFVEEAGRFVVEQRIDQPHPDAYSFARSNAIEGDTLVLAELDGADLWVYQRDDDNWQQSQLIEYPSHLVEATSFPRYAYNLELRDGWLFVSASNADRLGVRRAGVVVAYRQQPDGTFADPQVIATPEPGHIEEINEPIMRNGVLAVTSRGIDATTADQIVAHTFRLEGGTWSYDQAVRGSGTNDRLYATIGLSSDASQMLVSDRDRGHVYAFERDASGLYHEVGRVGAESGLVFSYAGLASDGRTAYVGAPGQRIDGVPEVGAVAVIDVLCERCTADLTGDGRADTADVLVFLNLFELGDLAADFDGDGVLTPADLDAFQIALAAGCPPRPIGCQPRIVKTIDEFGPVGAVLLDGSFAYAHSTSMGFLVLDVRDPTAPVLLGGLPASDLAGRISRNGETAYFAGPDRELVVADVSDPTSPEVLGTFDAVEDLLHATASGDLVAMTRARADRGGAIVFDVSDPRSPVEVGEIRGNAFVARNDLFVAAAGQHLEVGSLAVYDAGLVRIAEAPVNGEGQSIALNTSGDVAFVHSLNFYGPPPVGGFITAFDVRDPTNPVEIGRIAGAGRFSLVERNGYLYAGDQGGIYVYEVRDPSAMRLVHFVPTAARGADLLDHYLWASNGVGGLSIVDIATCLPCRADLDGDGEATVYDVLAFLRLFDAGDPSADFNQDGRLSLVDLLGFQRAVGLGCE
ncbi:MAG: GC-type dockerin domain-anchored protein [Phycisphaerales bacterium]|jgi:hypothetical protein